ncbi:MAG: flagellar basal body rod C-terminal domain-containing protein, partial [Syntrophales bacterium]|nr:flagellar basal body rod C-terminal domain-containing protein [Syntrophales bacterium]
ISGDGDNATSIAALQYNLVMEGNSSTLNAYHAATVGDVGRAVADSKVDLDQQATITDNISNRRESISGVSLDEEMINLMKYQMGYSAAGKLAQAANSMMDVLMSLGGK